jgi:hypothetical protein
VTLITQFFGESIGLGGVAVSLVSFAVVAYANRWPNRWGTESESAQRPGPGRIQQWDRHARPGLKDGF